MRTSLQKIGAMLALLLFAASTFFGQSSRKPVVTTPHFAFYSDFDTNLNDALIATGVARRFSKPQLFHAGDEVACFDKLPQSVRSAWNRAVDYYTEIISPKEWDSDEQYLLRVQLAGFNDEIKTAEDRQFVEIAQGFRMAAAPAYKACKWAAQDEKNHKWIAEIKLQLAENEQKVAARLEQLYQSQWSNLPIPVDIVETVNWSGANSILHGSGNGHLLISTANESPYMLEVVFHESSHILMGRNAPVRMALNEAASAANFKMPGDLWHVVLFYTTGEAVRRILEEEGKPAYKPMLYGIFDRGAWPGYRSALESAWKPYVDGKQSLKEASAGLIAALQKQTPSTK